MAVPQSRGWPTPIAIYILLDTSSQSDSRCIVMPGNRVRAIVVVFGVVGLLAVLIWRGRSGYRPAPLPPVLNVVSMEPAGVMEYGDAEMWLVTLRFTNPD